MAQCCAFATGVPDDINAFTAPPSVPNTPAILEPSGLKRNSTVEPLDFTPHLLGRLRTLKAQ